MRKAPSVTLDVPTLMFTAVWYKPGHARISVRTTGAVSLKDAGGALAEGIKLLLNATERKADVPEVPRIPDALRPTFRPERVA
jgi:hypothetical protein